MEQEVSQMLKPWKATKSSSMPDPLLHIMGRLCLLLEETSSIVWQRLTEDKGLVDNAGILSAGFECTNLGSCQRSAETTEKSRPLIMHKVKQTSAESTADPCVDRLLFSCLRLMSGPYSMSPDIAVCLHPKTALPPQSIRLFRFACFAENPRDRLTFQE